MVPADRLPMVDDLGEYWNAVIAERPISPAIELDSSFIDAIERVRRLDDTLPPDPTFVQELERDLFSGRGAVVSIGPVNLVAPDHNGVTGREERHRVPAARRAPAHAVPPALSITPRDDAPAVLVPRPGALPAPLDASSRISLPAMLSLAALVVLSLGLAIFGGMLRQRAEERNWAPPVLPAIQNDPAEFVWQSVGLPNLLATRESANLQPFSAPYHLAIDARGNLWIPDAWNNHVRVLGPDGGLRQVWGSKGRGEGEFSFFNSASFVQNGNGAAAFDAAGNLYVADPGNYRIQKFAPDLRFLTAWGSKGEGDGQFLGLNDLAIDDEGRVYALDMVRHDVQVFDDSGEFILRWGTRGVGDGEFLSPRGLAIDEAGDVLVVDTGNHRLQKFAPDGAFLAAWGEMGTEPGLFREPDDTAVDATGRVYVTDTMNNRVQILDPDGQFLAEWGGRGKEPGQLEVPTGIALDKAGNVYVAEGINNRVQKFRLLPPLGT